MVNKVKKLIRLLPPLLVRDIKERYAGSVLGVFWTFLQPLLLILLYWAVFSQIMRIRVRVDTGDVPFFAFLLTGLIPWFALQEGVLRGASSIVEKRHVIKKVIFPSELFPIATVLTSLLHHGIGFFLFLLIYFLWQGEISLFQISFITGLVLIQLILTTGLSLLFASLTVYLRDIYQVLGMLFQALFYMSTILFPMTIVPDRLKLFISLNPVTSLSESYHSIILYNRLPEIGHIIYLSFVTLAVFIGGVYFFRKLKSGFSDVL
jgi:ABC-type polysaccharide/polyol phosphate export permease